MMLLLKKKARETAPIGKKLPIDAGFSSTASGKSLVTCLIKIVYMDYYELACPCEKRGKCYVFV